jgi:two-component sensor histidine kinase
MFRKQACVLFIFLTAASILCFATAVPDSLSLLVKHDAAKAIRILEKPGNAFTKDLRYYTLLAEAMENLGRHFEVDSILDRLIRDPQVKRDSAAYMNLLILDAENNKILDRFEEAFSELGVVLKYRQQQGDSAGILDIYLTMAEYFRATEDYDYALSYLDKANEVGKNIQPGFPPLLKARLLNRKAAIYLQQAIHLDSVERFSKEAIAIGFAEKDLNLVATSSNELGFLYLNMDRKEAEKYLLQAVSIWENLGYGTYAHNARLNLARFYTRMKQTDKAIRLCVEEQKIVKANHWDIQECNVFDVLAGAYAAAGDFKNAFRYSERAKEGLLYNARKQYTATLAYYFKKMELGEKENEITHKSNEVLLAKGQVKVESRAKERLIFFLIVSVSIILVTVIAIVTISRQKRQLSAQKEEIDNINITLNNLVAQKEALLKEVNHRVKNNLGLLSGLMYLEEQKVNADETVRVLQKMQGRVNTISLIHETLYQRDDMEQVNLQEYLSQLWIRTSQLYPGINNVEVEIDCRDFNPELSLAIPLSMMVNELMTNSLKHAFVHVTTPQIRILYDTVLNQIEYMDNGPGYDSQQSFSSLGKNLIAIFAKQIGATLTFEKNDSFFIIRIKLEEPKL